MTYDDYRAAGHDHDTATALVGIDGICTQHARVNAMQHALLKRNGTSTTNGASRARETSGSTNARRRGSRRTTSSTSSSSSGDDPPDPEPAERRLCENARCQADISHLHSLARFCPGGACKQAAYRDRRTREILDEVENTVITTLSCVCDPEHNLTEHGHCLKCGYPRDAVTRGWVDENGAPRARSFVSSRARRHRNPRLGDRKRKPVHERQVDPAALKVVAA
jgi:hypothetical protein